MTQAKIESNQTIGPTRVKVILDIDGVLVSRNDTVKDTTPVSLYLESQGTTLFPTPSQTPYYVFPGVLELIRFLASRDDVDFGFFSAGHKHRNKNLFDQLLLAALGETGLKKPEFFPHLLSRDDMVFEEDITGKSIRRKNLHKIVHLNDHKQLGYTILVDDQVSNAASGQEHNMLRSPKVAWSDFCNLHDFELLDTPKGWEHPFMGHLNHIYYITGVLIECLEKAPEMPATEVLRPLHFDQQETPDFFTQTMKQKHWYDKGLACLQQLNPDLNFNTHTHFMKTLRRIEHDALAPSLQIASVPSSSSSIQPEQEPELSRRPDSPRPSCSKEMISGTLPNKEPSHYYSTNKSQFYAPVPKHQKSQLPPMPPRIHN